MLRAKVNGKMRAVSPAMARRLRAKGIAVEDTAQAAVTPKPNSYIVPPAPPAPVAKVVTAIEKTPPLPAAPWPTQPKALEQAPPAPAFDLTDEELERLTAPDGGE